MKIEHSENGMSVTKDGKKLLLGFMSLGNEGEKLTNEERISMLDLVNKFQSDVRGLPYNPVTKLLEDEFDYSIKDERFYKYVSKDVYDRYVKKGVFQVGSISYYQAIENLNAKDSHEGSLNVYGLVNNHELFCSAFTGYNYYILCGTSLTGSAQHNKQFGEVQLSIPDIKGFCRLIMREIGATSYFIGKVKYDNSRLFKSPDIQIENFEPSNIIKDGLANELYKSGVKPSLFIKPESYAPESEIRVIFEMPSDVSGARTITNKQLLNYVGVTQPS